MTQMNLSEARERAGLQASRSRGLVVGTVVPCFFAVVAVGLVCFSLLPQRQAMNLTMMPTSAFRNVGENFTGGVQNPYYRPPGGDPFAGPRRLSRLTRTTASSLTWTSAAAEGSPTRS
jgi:hypothetical protein